MNKAALIRWLKRPRNAFAVGGAAILIVGGVLAFAVFFSGYAVGRYELGPFTFAQRAEYKLFGVRFERAARDQKTSNWLEGADRVKSIFVDLDMDVGVVPVKRDGAGGGMTSFGDAVVLLTHEGRIFAIRSGNDIVPMSITVPDNGFDAYKAAAEGPLKDYQHSFGYFRYNDIIHYRSDTMRGLAISYTEWNAQMGCYRTAIATLAIDRAIETIDDVTAAADDWKIVFRTQPCLPPKKEYHAIEGHTAGGRMAFRAPGSLFLASGDYGWDGVYAPKAIAQEPDNDYGKVIEIDLAAGAAARHVSIGHRNTQGITFDPKGDLWVVEHGHRGGDELNRIIDGRNYGWPLETLGTRYNGLPIPNTISYGRHDVYAAPVFAWLPSVAVSSLAVIDNFHESWDGDFLIGGLNSMSIFRTRIANGYVQFEEQIPIGQRIRYVHQHTDGRIVLWTDDEFVVFLTPAKQDATAQFIEDHVSASGLDAELKTQVQSAIEGCMQCHSFRPDEHQNAPGLGAIAGERFGSTKFAGYSAAMRAASGYWDEENLIAFLEQPSRVVPGTVMPDPNIADPRVRGEIAKLLEALKNSGE